MINKSVLCALVVMGLSLGSTAKASLTWDFASTVLSFDKNSGTVTSTSGSPNKTITAYGVNAASGAGEQLYVKNGGGSGITGENGLGTVLGTHNEIDSTHIIELDLTNLDPGTSISFLISSLQANESFKYAGKNSAGIGKYSDFTITPGSGSAVSSGSPVNDPFTFVRSSATNEFIAIAATNYDVLLATATGTLPAATPEPRFYSVLLAGFLAIVVIRYRRVPEL